MKNKRKFIIIFLICFAMSVLCFSSLFVVFGPFRKYKKSKWLRINNICKTEECAQQHSAESLHVFLEMWIEDDGEPALTVSNLREHFRLRYLRRTFQGYYAVIVADNSEKLYVFLNEKLEIWDCLILSIFPSQEGAQEQIKSIMRRQNQDYEISIPFCYLPTGSLCIAYYYEDGIETVQYGIIDEFDDKIVYTGTLFQYYSNSNMRVNLLFMLQYYRSIPFIIDNDRKS
ncbi:MAG: hypothetical protein FWF10_03300 [Clostridiales bacterium]|nr:hypothetical protein [Clostridiales bacterium]